MRRVTGNTGYESFSVWNCPRHFSIGSHNSHLNRLWRYGVVWRSDFAALVWVVQREDKKVRVCVFPWHDLLKPCLHVTIALQSTSALPFNILFMITEIQMQRVDSHPFPAFASLLAQMQNLTKTLNLSVNRTLNLLDLGRSKSHYLVCSSSWVSEQVLSRMDRN